ncbi:hypothetical protein GGR54DRAFT_564374 [Hypoxylon sp. NC1633]|nr:hypothetical protein GGR54DRAFT_564374 [Hypoxylon sp. NC1633]
MDGSTSRLPSSSVPSVTTPHPTNHQKAHGYFRNLPATPSTSMDPPRPAKEGHEWVWFPAGYWAEREVAESPGRVMKHFKWRKRSGKSSSGKDTQDDPDHWDHMPKAPHPLPSPIHSEDSRVHSLQRPPFTRHGTSSGSGVSSFPLNRALQSPLPSPYLTEETHVQSLQRSPLGYEAEESDLSLFRSNNTIQTSPPIDVHGDSISAAPLADPLSSLTGQRTGTSVASRSSSHRLTTARRESFKTKKSLITRLLPGYKTREYKNTYSDNDAYDYTRDTIEGVQAQLLSQQHRRSATPPIMTRVASLLREECKRPAWPRSFRLFGKSPWHRKASVGSEASASSSVRDVLRGRTPVASPASDIEPQAALFVPFPGGEATRVQTPPLRESGPQRAGLPRSFFFDISTPPHRSSSSSSSRRRRQASYRCPPLTPMYDNLPTPVPVELVTTEARGREWEKEKKDSGKEWWEVPAAVRRDQALLWPHSTAAFEFDLPEHLPTSPMCPTNKRHKSGGTGVCVYHGRRKKSGGKSDVGENDDDGEDREVWT